MPQHHIIDLKRIVDARGSLCFAQVPDQIPFTPVRLFTLYDLAAGTERGNHAHRQQHQLVIMMRGAAKIEVDDGAHRTIVNLGTPSHALHVPPLLWLRLKFLEPSVCTVLASGPYDEADYIRSYDEFSTVSKNSRAT